jgi:hypothetical protein
LRATESTKIRAKMIHDIVDEYYESGRHDRCKLWIYRHKIFPALAISERTFWRYIGIKVNKD